MNMRFDTRDKKPRIWNILILTIGTAVMLGILGADGAEKHAIPISLVLSLFFLTAILLLLRAFWEQLQFNPYSYNTVYYMGFAMFLLSVLINHTKLTCIFVLSPGWFDGRKIDQVITLMKASARNYMRITSPFILVVSLALCISNLALIHHEGKRPVNLLGILLSVLLVGGEAVLGFLNYRISGSPAFVRAHELLINICVAGYLYFESMMIGLMVAYKITSRYQPRFDKDYLIILGCSIRKDGTPCPLLQGRIDRAIAFRDGQLQETGKDLIFVTSGGQGADEVISESASMKHYLMERGVPEDHIIEENLSTSTFENMKFSKEKILAQNPNARIAFSTSKYHVFRSGIFARRTKMRAVGMGAKSKWYFWPNALVREFIGLLSEHRGKQAAVFTGLVAIYVILTFSAPA